MHKFNATIFLSIFLILSCSREVENLPDLPYQSYSFHVDLFSQRVDSIPEKIPYFIEKYSPFFELFCSQVINIGFPEEERFRWLLQQFVADFRMQQVYKDILQQYSTTTNIDNQIKKAFQYYAYYFNKNYIPKIYYYHGGFNQSIIATDSLIGIGLDKYLGYNYTFYAKLGIPLYQRKKMRREYIPIDALRYYLYGQFPYFSENEHVLSHILYEGKIQYLLKKIFPDVHDTLLFGFSETQLIWCEKSERSMWQYLIDKKKLFSTDKMDIKRYTNDGPFTTTFPRESPGRAAVWLAYRIIEQYVKKNKVVNLVDLMNETDWQKIVQLSEYNP